MNYVSGSPWPLASNYIMIKKIDGSAIAERIKDKIAEEVFFHQPDRPNLAIILVGDRSDSRLYVNLKQREGRKVGIETHLYSLDRDTPESELISVINFLNNDPLIDGILIQLPLPPGFDTDRVVSSINPDKDVDGFHPRHPDYIVSPVLASISACLEEIRFDPAGKKACILYNSEVFGQSVKSFLEKRGMVVSLKKDSASADLLISALGEPHKIKKDMVKPGAVVLDIGITTQENGVSGDLDWEDVKDSVSYATPVPGGVGPMTVAFLLKNTLEIFNRRVR